MEVKHRLRLGPDLVAATIALSLPGIVLALWITPRPAIPVETPMLVLAASDERAAIAADVARASGAPDDALEAHRRELYRAQGLAELRGEGQDVASARQAELHAVLAEIAREHGEDAVAALRARDVERMIPALIGTGTEVERSEELGAFAESLARWGAVVAEHRVASEYVIRTLFAARWNVVHGRPPTNGFGALRLRAYHGWLAHHGDAAPPELRAAAIDAYEAAGGTDADEVRAMVAWQAGDTVGAAAAFERAFERTGNVRLRNHALAAALAE